jgi:hypothetical protein
MARTIRLEETMNPEWVQRILQEHENKIEELEKRLAGGAGAKPAAKSKGKGKK